MTSERKSAFILGGIAAIECGWVIWNLRLNGWRLFRYLGFAPGLTGAIPGWIAAALVVVIFVGFSLRLPSVRANLFRPSFLKFLAVLVAIGAGILEEVMFRRWTMNWLMAHGYGAIVQSTRSGSPLWTAPCRLGINGPKCVRCRGRYAGHRVSGPDARDRVTCYPGAALRPASSPTF